MNEGVSLAIWDSPTHISRHPGAEEAAPFASWRSPVYTPRRVKHQVCFRIRIRPTPPEN